MFADSHFGLSYISHFWLVNSHFLAYLLLFLIGWFVIHCFWFSLFIMFLLILFLYFRWSFPSCAHHHLTCLFLYFCCALYSIYICTVHHNYCIHTANMWQGPYPNLREITSYILYVLDHACDEERTWDVGRNASCAVSDCLHNIEAF